MHFKALATDGDGTLLQDGKMSEHTAKALERARSAGLIVLLVTGETRGELEKFPRPDLIDFIVAENGGLLIDPKRGFNEKLLGEPPPSNLVERLKIAGLNNLTIGRSIISLSTRHEELVRGIVESARCGWRVVRNRHDIMLLPEGIDKASGLEAALHYLRITRGQLVAVGDAENDHAMFKFAQIGVAVSDAVPFLKKRATHITRGGAGDGVVELLDLILRDELIPFKTAKV